jgi:hypothetical protein
LFDLLIGDWDRHEDQWLWASFKRNNKIMYEPVPRDRDQAFSKMDGVIPTMATQKWAMRKIQNFDYAITDIKGLSMSGNHLDRNFTTRLVVDDWKETATALQAALTDAVIDSSMKKMPTEIYSVYGKEVAAKLKQRRNHLVEYAVSYYQFLTEQVNITGTSAKEIFEVERNSDKNTTVTVYATGSDDQKTGIIYKRTFSV